MKKSNVTQELVNIYPEWTRVRTDDQSNGYLFLNSIALSLEDLEKEIREIRDNQYVMTANLDEIDLTYRVKLSADFEFDEDNSDPLFSNPIAPTVSGEENGTWHNVEIADNNDIESFWYTSIPNRASVIEVISGEDHELLTFDAVDSPQSGIWKHHLDGGHLWVEAIGGVKYIDTQDNEVTRGRIILEGETRKQTLEEEILVFAWDQKQKTRKEWKEIHQVKAYDIEDNVQIDLRSGDFNAGEYLDFYNLRYSRNRNKIDVFWDLGHNGTIPTLDRVEYISDEWQQLILGFSDRATTESWELLEETDNVISGEDITVSGLDMAIQPYSERFWIVDDSNILYCYDLSEETVSGVDDLRDLTPGSEVQIETEETHLVLGDTIQFTPWHARPLKEIIEYKIWYKEPDGTKYGLDGGTAVPFSSNFSKKVQASEDIKRSIEYEIEIPTTQRGEYLVVLEATFINGDVHKYRKIFQVQYKTPLTTIDLSSEISDPITGIEFDSDQKMWLKTSNDYYRVRLHKDVMLIDYDNKIIYFKENYSQVGIETDG